MPSRSPTACRCVQVLGIGLFINMLAMAPAQGTQTKKRILQAAGAAGLIGAAALLDPLVRANRDGGSPFFRTLSRVTSEAFDYEGVVLGLGGAWLLSDQRERPAVWRVTRAALASSVITRLLKIYVGRARPYASESSPAFLPIHLDGRFHSFPSGHTALAFSLAQAIDDEIDNGWVEAGLYAASSLVAWSRVRQDDHWLSDVTAGAIEGIAVTRMLRDGRLLPGRSRLVMTHDGLALVIPVAF